MILAWSASEHFCSWPGLNTIIAQTACNVTSICVVEFVQYLILDFKLPSCSECWIIPFGRFPGRLNFYMPTFRNTVNSIFIGGVRTYESGIDSVPKRRHIKIQTPGNHPKRKKYNNISYILLLYPHLVQIFSWALYFQTPVIYTVLKNCNLQDITSLFNP